MAIRYIWFDLGYTLVYLKREEKFQEILTNINVNMEIDRIRMAYHLADKFFMREHRGLLCKSREEFMPIYLKKLLGILNLQLKENEYLKVVTEEQIRASKDGYKNWVNFNGTEKILSLLKKKSIKLGIISNWDNTARDVLKTNNLDILLDEIIISSEVGYSKPDKKIFEYAIEKAKVKPEECLFVGDNYYDDIEGSQKVGMKAVLINPYGRIGIEELDYGEVISDITELIEFIKNNGGSDII